MRVACVFYHHPNTLSFANHTGGFGFFDLALRNGNIELKRDRERAMPSAENHPKQAQPGPRQQPGRGNLKALAWLEECK